MDVSEILRTESRFFENWTSHGFVLTTKKNESDIDYKDRTSKDSGVIFNVNKNVQQENFYDGFGAFLKAWATWLFNTVIKIFTCKWKDIEACPRGLWAKRSVKRIEFDITKPSILPKNYFIAKIDIYDIFPPIISLLSWDKVKTELFAEKLGKDIKTNGLTPTLKGGDFFIPIVFATISFTTIDNEKTSADVLFKCKKEPTDKTVELKYTLNS